MYPLTQLSSFALMSFRRGLAGLTDEEARVRLRKADGSQMNAIAWITGHVCWQWTLRATRAGFARGLTANEAERLNEMQALVHPFRNGATDATPPSLVHAMELFARVEGDSKWVAHADDALLATMVDTTPPPNAGKAMVELHQWLVDRTIPGENLGTAFMRNILHAWFHIGEINLVRQMLGHAEIPFVGKMIGNLEWQPGSEGCYRPHDLARFALFSSDRGLEGLGEQDATTRLTKADGSETNSISWTVAHLGRHWLSARTDALGESVSASLQRFATGSTDPTPPSLLDARGVLDAAQQSIDWIEGASDGFLSNGPPSARNGERPGTRLMRAVLHTWFHIGEINGIRQMLGHAEIGFVGKMAGNLEWHPERETAHV